MIIVFVFSCDRGYGGPFCVALEQLPCNARDTFDQGVNNTVWQETYGTETSSRCDTLMSGTALVFYKVINYLIKKTPNRIYSS